MLLSGAPAGSIVKDSKEKYLESLPGRCSLISPAARRTLCRVSSGGVRKNQFLASISFNDG